MACQSSWTLKYHSNLCALTLVISGKDSSLGPVTDIQVPDHPDFEDEQVLVSVPSLLMRIIFLHRIEK